MHSIGRLIRKYSSVSSKMSMENSKKNVNIVKEEICDNYIMSRRQREKGMKLDLKIYENLRRKMLGIPLNKLQRKYMNEKRPNFAPVFLDQLKPRMVLYKVAIKVNELPLPKYPEIAFIGRSNSGKSTLINELCGRTNKAKVSKMPGCTKQIHFYKIGKPCLLCLVDLPGYGFAHSKEELRLQWNEFTLFYLKNRTNLKKVFVLIDCRIGLKTSDKELFHFFDRYNIKYQIVLSKCDLLNTKDLAIKIQIMNEEILHFKNLEKNIISLSSLKRQNLNELRNEIAKYQLNKTIIKNNIIMKINDLIEQKKLKKLKNLKGMDSSHITEGNRSYNNGFHSIENEENVYDEDILKKNKRKENISKDILISDDTIFEAINRWKISDNNIGDTNFNKYMNFYTRNLINSVQEHFLNKCQKLYNEQDLKVIDNIIENLEGDNNHSDTSVLRKHNKHLENKEKEEKKKIYINSEDKFKKESTYMKKKTHNLELAINYENAIKNRSPDLDLQNKENGNTLNKIPVNFEKLNISCEHETSVDKKVYNNTTHNEYFLDGSYMKYKLEKKHDSYIEKGNEKSTEYEVYDNSNSFNVENNQINIENDLFNTSLLFFDEKKSSDSEYVYSKNVEMGDLFENNNCSNNYNKGDKDHFKNFDYSKIKNDTLLEEDETYSKEDYMSGLKMGRVKKNMYNNNPLNDYTFNINDKNTYNIYEKSKSEAYKIYMGQQLENFHNNQNSNLSKDMKRTNNLKMKNTNLNDYDGTNTNKNLIVSKNEEDAYTRKHYIGLKTRNKIIRGTKKLKLFGKNRTKEIVNVPIDLATDYFKLNNNSEFYDKKNKKNNWNYINSKYNKWLKKMGGKNISSEIIGSVRKEDVMRRYAQKQEGKYSKEKNKLLIQKKKLGMITKPPSHNKKGKYSKNYNISDEQKMFDREAFFKYRDVQK
ncbi:GTP-binding protein, putative [Plasmodium berghei]|uniref:GTP-binding protein, putative n=2 Tax=Plasmodium berghei TaxID=5821 RepID=A0A509ARU7_PLABA|nr:GTP-binding protein, putative [Plasmodium berghei ANKA]SCL95995.1 GTP-binding protein, putative [Plasmodium berghei]SCM16335.1 GTP-binding protein, putative [Plasmodium berghei]SCM18131.1 GTP-binding protein, putative [Plasmodium berghei]SCN27558.1 GTP-binding protein, putative [Plasmodium berghei]VUC57443.1 GTP-binding protein, putative [Plasmodium berghei ANKA]|eukprot:XP_034423214.1 GTP-binding protein, putative [Plasmodium berghei ANKA]